MPSTTSPRSLPYPVSNDPVAITADIQALAEAVNDLGYVFSERVTFTSSGTFDKATHPGLKAVRVMCQGAGSGATGADTTGSGQSAAGNGGGSGNYAESWILEAALAASETVTVGTGGAGASGSNSVDFGDSGGDTSFGSLVIADGAFGAGAGITAGTTVEFGYSSSGAPGTADEAGSVGDVVVLGDTGHPAFRVGGTSSISGRGASSRFGRGGDPKNTGFDGSTNGEDGSGFGAGGGAGVNGQSQGVERTGGAGSPGVVFVDVYI